MAHLKKFDSLHGVVKRLKREIYSMAQEMYIKTMSDLMLHKLKTEDDIEIDNADVVWDECVNNATIAIFNLCSNEKNIDNLVAEYDREEIQKIHFYLYGE